MVEDTKQSMIDRVKFDCWMIVATLNRDKDLNPNGVSTDKILSVLNETGLYAYKPAVITAISDLNKEKWFDYYQLTKRWTNKWK